MDIVLGLDLGTTNCKVLAVGADGQPLAIASAPTPVHFVALDENGERGEEYDPVELWQTCARLIREVCTQFGADYNVAGIAVASMGESGVLLDAHGEPLAPIIVWYDRRTVPLLDWWRQRIDDATLYSTTGLWLRHVYSAQKLLWYRAHAPALLARARVWLCVADWITFCLTGQYSTSYSMASRTMLFDVRQRGWSDSLLRASELPPELLPPIFPSGQVVGAVTQDAASATGLAPGTPVATGGHDHACAALAAGVIDPGHVLDSSGTVEAILIPLTAPILEPALVGMSCGCHTARDRYYLIGGVMSGAIVDWMARLLSGDDSPASVNQLMDQAAGAPVGANGLWFAPYLDGTGSRWNDAEAWGAWLGLRLHHTRPDIVRAAMEGLTFSIRDMLDRILDVANVHAQELRAVGGGTRNAWWQQLKADILGVPIETLAVSDVTAQGAALLAGIAVHIFGDEADAVARAYRPAARYPVDSAHHVQYDALYPVFQKLYPALKTVAL